MSNSSKVWLFIATLTLAFLLVGYHYGERLGLLIGFCLAVFLNLSIFFFGQSQLLKHLRAEQIKGQDGWSLGHIIESYSKKVGLEPLPRVYLVDVPTPIAFSFGVSLNKTAIVVSRSLLTHLTPEELKAVIVHQICHIRRLDTFVFSVSQLISNSFLGVAQFLDRYWILNLLMGLKQRPFFILLSPIAWLFIRIAVSPRLFRENDELAASLLGDRKSLAYALWKLDGYRKALPYTTPSFTQHFFIVNPEGERAKLFPQPSVNERIRNLLGHYPI